MYNIDMIKILEKIKQIFKNKNVQAGVIIFLGFYFASTILLAVIFNGGTAKNEIILNWLLYAPLVLPVSFIIFIPTFILLYYIFKKTNKPIIRILSISFFIPFINLIYFYIEMQMSVSMIYYSCMLGALCLFLILPIAFVITLFIPKKIFQIKKEALLTILLTTVFGWLLIGSIIPTSIVINKIFPKPRTSFWNPFITHQLEAYRPTINYIESYHKDNKKFPKNIPSEKINSKSYPYYKYETFNDKNDFILTVSNYKFKENCIFCYRYCSSQELPKCKAIGYDKGSIYWKLGDWVYESWDD